MKKILHLTIVLILFFGCSKKDIKPPPDMVKVPEGEFIIGSNDFKTKEVKEQFKSSKPLFVDEYPERKIFLETFLLDKYEVTNINFLKFRKEFKYQQTKDNHPAVLVNWFEASKYCESKDRRLPTEEEWEKAARGPEGKIFPWGNTFNVKFANTGRSELKSTKPVGMFEAGKSFYGIFDMIGNVGEWTKSWYKAYPGSDYKNANHGNKLRIIRGSSWGGVGHYKMEAYDRASFRRSADQGAKIPDVGFRCAS